MAILKFRFNQIQLKVKLSSIGIKTKIFTFSSIYLGILSQHTHLNQQYIMIDIKTIARIVILFMDLIRKIDLNEGQNTHNVIGLEGEISSLTFHTQTIQQLIDKYGSNLENGITEDRRQEIIKKHGLNVIKSNNLGFQKFCNKFWTILHPYSILNMVGGVALLIYQIIERNFMKTIMTYFVACFMIAISLLFFVINVIIQIADKKQYQNIDLGYYKVMCKSEFSEVSNNNQKFIYYKDIVEGDIIEIQEDMIIPADLRIIQSQDLQLNRTWNGQSGSYKVSVQRVDESTANNILKANNMVFFPSLCTKGRGRGLVVQAGYKTVLSRMIQDEQSSKNKRKKTSSKIINGLYGFLSILSIVAGAMSVLFFFVRSEFNWQQDKWIQNIIYMIGVLLSFMPLSLPFQVFLFLWICKKIASRRRIQFDNILTLQKLREIDCLCIDDSKNLRQYQISHIGYQNKIIIKKGNSIKTKNQTLEKLAQCVLRTTLENDKLQSCIASYFQQEKQKNPIPKNSHQSVFKLRSGDQGFESVYEIHQSQSQNSELCVFLKGDALTVWNQCVNVYHSQGSIKISNSLRQQFQFDIKNLQAHGQNIIGYAKLHLQKQKYHKKYQFKQQDFSILKKENFSFVGFVSYKQRLNSSMVEFWKQIQQTGINIILLRQQPYKQFRRKEYLQQLQQKQKDPRREFGGDKSPRIRQQVQQNFFLSRDQIQNDFQNYKKNKKEHFAIKKWFSKKKLVIFELNYNLKNQVMNFLATQTDKRICFVTADEKCLSAMKSNIIGVTFDSSKQLLKKGADVVIKETNFLLVFQALKISRQLYLNLKKSIVFNLSIQTPKIGGILLFLFFKNYFNPIISILICLQFFITLPPGICFAFQQSQEDVMKQPPPNKRQKSLINTPVILQSYGYIGIIFLIAGLFCFVSTLIDYGIPSLEELKQSMKTHWINNNRTAIWITKSNNLYLNNEGDCKVQRFVRNFAGPTLYKLCSNLQSVKFAEWSFFGAIFVCQLFNILVCQLRRHSILSRDWKNSGMILGALSSVGFWTLIIYLRPFNQLLQSKDNNFIHSGICACSFGILIIVVDEVKKLMMRKWGRNQDRSRNMLAEMAEW